MVYITGPTHKHCKTSINPRKRLNCLYSIHLWRKQFAKSGFGWCLVWAAHLSVLTLLIITSVLSKAFQTLLSNSQ